EDAAQTTGVQHGRIRRVHGKPAHGQVAQAGVHREPMLAAVQALEDAAARASHIKRLTVRWVDDDGGAFPHTEIADAVIDRLPRVSAVGASEYALSRGSRVDGQRRAGIYCDGPSGDIQHFGPGLATVFGKKNPLSTRVEESSTLIWIGGQKPNRA